MVVIATEEGICLGSLNDSVPIMIWREATAGLTLSPARESRPGHPSEIQNWHKLQYSFNPLLPTCLPPISPRYNNSDTA